MRHLMFLGVSEDGLEGLEVGVDISKNGETHVGQGCLAGGI